VEFASNPSGSGTTTNWEHWDPASGDIVFENGASTDFALGRAALSNLSNGITVEDRDPFGQLASTHDSYQFAKWSGISKTVYGLQVPGTQSSGYTGSDPQNVSRILTAERTDAYIDH
jgi:hypothetical protein